MTQIINGIAGTEALGASQPDGSVREQFQNGARASRGFALLEVMNTLTDLSDKELEKINKIRRRQKHYVKRYKRYAARLEAVDALALFPEAMAPLKSLLQKLGSDLDVPAPKPRRTAASSDTSEKTGDAETEVADKVPPDESTRGLPPDEEEKKKAEASTKETGTEPLS